MRDIDYVMLRHNGKLLRKKRGLNLVFCNNIDKIEDGYAK